ncbi:G5 domain-containing protein [Candidatus Saccharibacteria bacterium]|nr:G5 domain-containing protein [Candidatus Saccharibacteria bacterium]
MKKRFFVGIALIFIAYFAYASFVKTPNARAVDTRVVTVHIDGEDKVIATNADTVKEVVKNLALPPGEFDKTEPGLNEPVVGSEFTINVYRARPITVVDGANNYTVMTAERTPKLIAKEAGFQTSPEDDYDFERADSPFDTSTGTEMYIKRAKNITLDLYGTASGVRTNENTVADFLDERGINLEKGDELNVPKESRITEGMTISIAQVERNVETVEEVAPFPEERIQDANQPLGYRQVKTPGKDGKKLVTYELVSRNGGEAERNPIKEVITVQPTKQVVVVGAKQIVSAPGNCGEWLAQAGINNADAVYLVAKESGCNPGAVNRSSGACGIPQALPCSKLPCPLDASGAVCQLTWMNQYVLGRYGSWAAARAHHAARGWY